MSTRRRFSGDFKAKVALEAGTTSFPKSSRNRCVKA